MIIYFLRHANAGERVNNPKKDEKRALDQIGIEQCGNVGRALAALDTRVEVIISSPLKRAAQTASLVGNEMGYEGKLQLDDALRPDASFSDFRNLSEFVGRCISQTGCEAGIALRKGAVAKVDMGRNSASLHWCLTPKVLRTLYSVAAESSRPKTSRK